MIQDYEKYSNDDHAVWKILFERQYQNLQNKSCREYLDCLSHLNPVLNSESIPNFELLSKQLDDSTGWGIHVVPGLIPVDKFFYLLSKRKFCSSTWVRSKDSLDYIEEPDMLHDIFGHIPLLINNKYADFMQGFGSLGVEYSSDQAILVKLQRLYWFTVEFGLMNSINNPLIYGSGIVSSFGETNHIFKKDVEILNFELDDVINNDFIISEIQTRYYAITDLNDLQDILKDMRLLLTS